MPRSVHLLWTYFTKLESQDEDICNKCKQILGCKESSSSSLRHRLKAIHTEDAANLLKDEIAKRVKLGKVYEGIAQAVDDEEAVKEHDTREKLIIYLNLHVTFLTKFQLLINILLNILFSFEILQLRLMMPRYN